MSANKMKKKKKIIKRGFRIFNIVLWGIFIIAFIYLLYNVFKINMVPSKYIIVGGIVLLFIVLVTGVITIFKKTGFLIFIITDLVMILFMCFYFYTGSKINLLYNFLENSFGIKYKTNIYDVIVKSDSHYSSFESISEKQIIYYPDNNDEENVLITLAKEKINNPDLIKGDNINESLIKVTNDSNYILIVNSGDYDAMVGIDEEYDKKTKIIGTIEIKVEDEKTNNKKNNDNNSIIDNSFIVYICGIDTRSGKLPIKSLSDVNIIMAVNPQKRKVLMVHIPRDSYVEVHGKSGLKDKLTHTGTIGGVNLTMETIEDLLDIDLTYYIRLNFNSVIRLVDAIGGIDVYSDVNYQFNSYNLPSLTIYPLQMNHLNGNEALAFAKERHAYATGDKHRGENQEQVIQRIIEKIGQSQTLLTKYDDILKALDGTFETNILNSDISALVKMQLNDMKKWSFETYNINGTGALDYTYSYPNQKLYVMYPDTVTIDEAIKKLNDVMDEK